MKVVLHSTHTKYAGSIELPPENQPRLQDIVNNPVMFFKVQGMAVREVVLCDATIYLADSDTADLRALPILCLDPARIEVLYETSAQDHAPLERVAYEKRAAALDEAQVEIITAGRRRIRGLCYQGMRPLTHPIPERPFFALTQVEMEVPCPVPHAERLRYILVNRPHVESFRQLR